MDIYVIKNKINGRYYQYIGKGCHRWVKSTIAADNFALPKAFDMVDDLRCQGYDAIEWHIDNDLDAIEHEIINATPEEINQYLRDAGYDPDAIGKKMQQIAQKASDESPMNPKNKGLQS